MQSCLSDDLNHFASPSFPDADLPEELKALLKSIGDSATALFSTTQFTPHVPGEPPGEPPEPPPHNFFTPPDVGWPVSPSSPYSPFSTPSSKTSFSSPNTVYSSGEFTSASPPPQFLSAPSLPPANVYPASFTQPNMIFATVPWMFSFHALQAAGGVQGSYSGVIESDAVAMILKTSVERPLPKQWTCPKCNRGSHPLRLQSAHV